MKRHRAVDVPACPRHQMTVANDLEDFVRSLWISLLSAVLSFCVVSLLQPPAIADDGRNKNEEKGEQKARTLYIWAGDQARIAPDFLAVIDFDEDSDNYGKVIKTV